MTGIDNLIQDIRDAFTERLFQGKNVVFYGKSYRNLVASNDGKDRVVAEIYNEAEQNYEEIQFDDRLDGLCYFDLGDEITNLANDGQPQREMSIVFVLNVEAINSNLKRDLEPIYEKVLFLLKYDFGLVFSFDKIITGERAYGGVDISRLKHPNIQPYHVFAVKGTAKVFYDNC